jgi:hypothetical protein
MRRYTTCSTVLFRKEEEDKRRDQVEFLPHKNYIISYSLRKIITYQREFSDRDSHTLFDVNFEKETSHTNHLVLMNMAL